MTDKELIQAARTCQRTRGCGRCTLFNECPGRAAYLAMAADRLEALLAENERMVQTAVIARADGGITITCQSFGWISVEERLPEAELETATADEPDDAITCELSACVLVVDRTGEVRVARYELGPYFQGWQENGRAVGEVTHWMPLPEPPSTEGVE